MSALIEVNTDGLAKLGKTICYGLGITAFGHKQMANAEAYAAIKKAETDTKIKLLNLKRDEEIANYIRARESRKMNNAKSIVEEAISHFECGEKVSDEPVNEDWTNRFFSIIEDISDKSLQKIWGQILAGEVKQPKSYSLRTLDVLRNITKEEAELFIKATQFYIEKNFICTEEQFLSPQEVWLLGETGLINNDDLIKSWDVEPNSKLEVLLDKNILIVLHNNSNKKNFCSISVKKLSKAGIEILSLIDKQVDRATFYNALTSILKSRGLSRVVKHEILQYTDNQCSYKTIGEEL